LPRTADIAARVFGLIGMRKLIVDLAIRSPNFWVMAQTIEQK
jgi:hypothetical protein